MFYHFELHKSENDKWWQINAQEEEILWWEMTVLSTQRHHSMSRSCWWKLVFHIISWGKLCPVSYSGSMRGSRLHITFTHHRFQDCSVQVFLSGQNEFVYWAKAGHATHTCWKQWHSKEPVFICFSAYSLFFIWICGISTKTEKTCKGRWKCI